MATENEIKIGEVLISFQMSLQVATTVSSPPTDFTKNYIDTLVRIAGEHFIQQMQESIVERIGQDFAQYPKDKLWEAKS